MGKVYYNTEKQTSMKSKMTYFIAFILFSIIIALGGVHARTLVQQSAYADMTHEGQLYDCVDFYEQPAFSHPLLKDLVPKVRQNFTTSMKVKFNEKDGGCPVGTVPIITLREGEQPPPRLPPPQAHCYAVVRTTLGGSNRQFYGTYASPSVYKPDVQGHQWSAYRLKLASGDTSTDESIEAGWVVFPDYYKDNEAHIYVKFKNGGSECFNTDCPGFVQVSRRLALGAKPNKYAQIGGTQYISNIAIELNKGDGNWHLSFTTQAAGKVEIGYWPGTVFKQLKNSAAQAEWGGEINNPGAVNPAPFMGSGRMPYENDAAYFKRITVIDNTNNHVNPQGTEIFTDCHDLYVIEDKGDQGGSDGRIIYYGGRQSYNL